MKLLQDGANSAFHEAVGDTFFYSIFGPAHLQRLGLAEDTDGSSKDGELAGNGRSLITGGPRRTAQKVLPLQ